jgi:hypothetical protein
VQYMASKIDIGARFRAHSGEIVEGRVVHMWEGKIGVDGASCIWRIYHVPARMLVDETKAK